VQRDAEPAPDARRPPVGPDDEAGTHGGDDVVELVAQRRRLAGSHLDVADPAEHCRTRRGRGLAERLARLGMPDVQAARHARQQLVQRRGKRLGLGGVGHLVVGDGPCDVVPTRVEQGLLQVQRE
jgi:hypothetical protein